MKVIHVWKFVYSDCGYKHDIMFGAVPYRHIFWRFWVKE